MGKRKVALFMAAILTVTSVYPSGVVFAEDTVAIETTLETAADEISENADIADPAKEQVTEPAEELADNPAGQPADDADAELVDDEIMPPVEDENADPENAAEDQTADSEGTLLDTIKADEELEIDLSDATQTMPVADVGEEDGRKTIAKVEINPETRYEARPIWEIMMSIPAEVTYEGDSSATEVEGLYIDKEKIGSEYRDVWHYFTMEGNSICLTLWDAAGGTLLDMPEDDILIGTYKLRLYVNGMPMSNGEDYQITINEPEVDNQIEINRDVDYDLTSEGEKVWYSYTYNGEENAENIFTMTRSVGEARAYIYQVDGANSTLKYVMGNSVNRYRDTAYVLFDVEPEKEYRIVVQEDGDEETHLASGKLCIKKRKAVADASFTVDFTELDTFEVYDKLTTIPAEIIYDETEKMAVSRWWPGRHGSEKEGLYTEDLIDDAYIEFLSADGEVVDGPLNGATLDIMPGTYRMRLCVNGISYGDVKEFTIKTNSRDLPINRHIDYDISEKGYECFKFVPDSEKAYVVKVTGEAAYIDVYTDMGDGRIISITYGETQCTIPKDSDTTYIVVRKDDDEASNIGEIWVEEQDVESTKPDHEHSYTAWVVTKEATCTEAGRKECRCSCGDVGGYGPVPALGHSWGEWKTVSAATVLAPEQQQRECLRCHEKETKKVGNPLPAKLTVPATKANMKTGQSTSVFNVEMAAGDSIVSVTSSNTKLMKVSSINKTGGTFKLKAGKKTGKVKITIKLASGQSKVITLTVQKKKVDTKKVKVTKKLTLKKGAKYTLKPVITPITTQDKVKFKSSNKKIATVTNKGVIKAKKPGKVTITVTCGKKKATCKITVTN